MFEELFIGLILGIIIGYLGRFWQEKQPEIKRCKECGRPKRY